MSCSYYWWDGDYACRKTGKTVSTDIYNKYCRNYDYDDCPIYKQESSSGGCFLTTACVKVKNLPDDCKELTVLRSFRDNWLMLQPCGKCTIDEYYWIAPQIVGAIDQKNNSDEIWNRLYEELVAPCVAFIEKGENDQAYSLYRQTVKALTEEYCVKE